MNREQCLGKAKECVTGKRTQDYGVVENSFEEIARLWTAYYDSRFTAMDVAMMMALLKIARIHTGTATEDSFVDLAGYAACGCEIATKKDPKEKPMELLTKPYSTVAKDNVEQERFYDRY